MGQEGRKGRLGLSEEENLFDVLDADHQDAISRIQPFANKVRHDASWAAQLGAFVYRALLPNK